MHYDPATARFSTHNAEEQPPAAHHTRLKLM
jgi:hypothetical protein